MTGRAREKKLTHPWSGTTQGYLVVTVDEILWLTEIRLESYHVKAEWWGSAKDQQV